MNIEDIKVGQKVRLTVNGDLVGRPYTAPTYSECTVDCWSKDDEMVVINVIEIYDKTLPVVQNMTLSDPNYLRRNLGAVSTVTPEILKAV